MPISELGYRHWEGTRVSPLRRWFSITRTDLGNAYRNSKLLQRLLFLAWMPLLYFGPLFFAIGFVADPESDIAEGGILPYLVRGFFSRRLADQLHENPGVFLPAIWAIVFFAFFAFAQSFLAMLIVAIVGPPLISRDVRSKAFLLYFSKPISLWEYFIGKLGVVLIFLFGITLFPALLLYVVSIFFSPASSTFFETATIILRIFLASLAISLPISVVVLFFSSLTKDRRVATFAWMSFWILGEVAFRMISLGASDSPDFEVPHWAFLLSLREVTVVAASAIFDVTGQIAHLAGQLQAMGIDPESLARTLSLGGTLGDQVRAGIETAKGGDVKEVFSSAPYAFAYLTGIIFLCTGVIIHRIAKPMRI